MSLKQNLISKVNDTVHSKYRSIYCHHMFSGVSGKAIYYNHCAKKSIQITGLIAFELHLVAPWAQLKVVGERCSHPGQQSPRDSKTNVLNFSHQIYYIQYVCRNTPLEINFIYLDYKEIYCFLETRYILSYFQKKKMLFILVLSSSVQITFSFFYK